MTSKGAACAAERSLTLWTEAMDHVARFAGLVGSGAVTQAEAERLNAMAKMEASMDALGELGRISCGRR